MRLELTLNESLNHYYCNKHLCQTGASVKWANPYSEHPSITDISPTGQHNIYPCEIYGFVQWKPVHTERLFRKTSRSSQIMFYCNEFRFVNLLELVGFFPNSAGSSRLLLHLFARTIALSDLIHCFFIPIRRFL